MKSFQSKKVFHRQGTGTIYVVELAESIQLLNQLPANGETVLIDGIKYRALGVEYPNQPPLPKGTTIGLIAVPVKEPTP